MPAPHRLATFVALLIAAVLFSVTIGFNTFTAWGTDSAAYLASGERWAKRDLFTPASLAFWAPWSLDGLVEAPLGQRPGHIKGTLTGVYPLGYPVLLAVALKLGGPLAPYVVAPIFAALLAWCAYVLGSQLAGPWAGVASAFLMAATPVTLQYTIVPMSDLPAVALWAVSWIMALRPGMGAAIAGGAAAGAAIMCRPNLGPLIVVMLGVAAVNGSHLRERTTRVFALGASALIGPVLVLWSQAVLYGGPFEAGYPNADQFFSVERVRTNAALYPRMLVELHSWLVPIVLGLGTISLLRKSPTTYPRAKVIVWSALAIIAVNYAMFLPYLTYQGWFWLRFMLPALLAIFILLGASLVRIQQVIQPRSWVLAAVMAVAVIAIAVYPRNEIARLFANVPGHWRVLMAGHYLREALPANAVIMAYLQSAGAAYYTGLPIIRLDAIPSNALDQAVRDLQRRGHHPVFMIDDAMETSGFRERFQTSQYHRLEWPPRAEFWSVTPLWYIDPADQQRFLNGEEYSVDVLKLPLDVPYSRDAALARAPGIRLPRTEETTAFRGTLDEKYRSGLGRSETSTYVDRKSAGLWIQRYLRYRLHSCSHAQALSRVFRQIDEQIVAPVCGRSRSDFPPHDEVAEFRRQLEAKYRDERREPPTPTHMDIVGDAIWTQEYLRFRLLNCSHDQATRRVFGLIEGTPSAGCAP